MKKKEEAKYLEKEWKQMSLHLKAFLQTGDQEHLHKFRVQVKKLKAMLTLFENSSHKHNLLKNFKPVKKIFRDAGSIRDAHTNLLLTERFEIKNEAFETGQQKIVEEGTLAFQHKGKKHIRQVKEAFKHLRKKLHPVHKNSVADYYKVLLEQIAVNLTVSGFTEDMHTNRKLIKILVYNHKLTDKAMGNELPFNIDYLNKLQDTIGKWHDNVLATELFSSPEVNDQPVVTLIKRKNAGVKRKIKRLADDFLRKATFINGQTNKTGNEWALK